MKEENMEKKVELHEYIRYVKDEIKKSEDPRPQKGFWIGATALELSFETTTEVSKEIGVKIYFLSGEGKKKKQNIQTAKINFVTQQY